MPASDLIGFMHVSLLGIVEVLDNVVQNTQASVFGSKPSRHLRNVAGKKVLITGGTSGVGEFTAKSLVEHGANVVITSRSLARAQATAKRLDDEVSRDKSYQGKARFYATRPVFTVKGGLSPRRSTNHHVQSSEHCANAAGRMQIRGIQLDLGNIDDVKRCATELKRTDDLDVLICNAGVMCPLEHTLTADHMEVQFQARLR